MMANGTQQDPYIVANWNEFLEYNTADKIGSYVKFSRSPYKVWDLARSYPLGFSDGLTIYPNIMGNGVEIINLCTKGGQFAIDFKGSVDNLTVTAMYVYDTHTAVIFENGANNLALSCEVGTTRELYVFNKDITADTTFDNCQFEFKCRNLSAATRFIYLCGGAQSTTVVLNNCDIYIDWDGFYGASFNVPLSLNASLIRGYINTPEYGVRFYDVKQVTTVDYPDSMIDLSIHAPNVYYGSYSGDTSAKVFYNADKTPEFASGSVENAWVGLTEEQIADETSLNSAGFHTGDGTPWEFDDDYDPPITQEGWRGDRDYCLGAFNYNEQFDRVNTSDIFVAVMPSGLQSLGRKSFGKDSYIKEVYLPATCTYYSTTFSTNNIHGGILIE